MDTSSLRVAVGESSLGVVLVAIDDRGVRAVLLGDDPATLRDDLRRRLPRATLVPAADAVLARVIALIEAPGGDLDVPIAPDGTAFQERVWAALRAVRAGSTVTYAELARRIGAPRSVRAVAGACAANPIAVLIPCHRVLRSDGGLSGYRWGVARKRALLEREAR